MRIPVCFLFLFFMANSPLVYAYVDPGTGSMLLQGLIAGVATGLGLISTYYKKIKNWLANLFSSKNQIAEDTSDSVVNKNTQ